MYRLVLVAFATLTLSTSAAAQQPQGRPKPPAKPGKSAAVLVREVQRHVRDYISAYNRADATGLSYAFSRRADVTSVIDGEVTRGYDAIRALNDEMAGEEVGSFKFAVGTLEVSLLGTSYALVVAPTTVTVKEPDGLVQLKGAMTMVLQRTPDGWRLINEHFSTKEQ
jgi:uncharacterized protein (TIGR02246 family)